MAEDTPPGEAQTLLAIAGTLAGQLELPEALRQTCRHLAHFTGADTVSVHVLDARRTQLMPAAAYRVPREALPVLAGEALPVDEQGFRDSVLAGEVAWSDDVQNDARFAFPLFRRLPQMLATSATDRYVDPADRERLQALLATDPVVEFSAELRRADGSTLWARMRVRATEEHGRIVYEGVIEDITDRRRVEEAERRAEALRYVAHLANAAAHEINNPLSVITARLEILRRQQKTDADVARVDTAITSVRRIADIIAQMGRLSRLELQGSTPNLPPILDIRRSSDSEPG